MANGEKVQVSHLPMPEMLECMQMRGLHGKESCERYSGFRQLSIFGTHQEPQYHSVPRRSWQHYGISKERYMKLTEYIQSGRYASLVSQAAHTANKTLSEYILLSITKNLSYEGLEKLWGVVRLNVCRMEEQIFTVFAVTQFIFLIWK